MPSATTKLLTVVEIAEKLKKQNGSLDYQKIASNAFKKTNDPYFEYSLILNAVLQNQLSIEILDKKRLDLAERGFNFAAMEARFVPNWPNFIEKIEPPIDPDKTKEPDDTPPTSSDEEHESDEEDDHPKPEKYGSFPQATRPLSKFKEVASDAALAHSWELEVQRHARADPVMKRLRKERDERHEAGFTYDVVQSRNSPKMVVHGAPRTDKDDCINEFYKMILNENVRVIVALNTFTDWKKAIHYYEKDQLAELNVGWKITCSEVNVLYEGSVATNIPKKMREEASSIPVDDIALSPYRVRIEERTLIARKEGETRTITHLHYVNWPDLNEAPDLFALELLMKRQESLLEKSDAPVSIHCQGGVARTLDYAMMVWMRREIREAKKLDEQLGEKQFNIPEMIYELRKQAPRLGGTPKEQRFALIYGITADYLEGKSYE